MGSAQKFENEIEYEDDSIYATFGCLDANTMTKNDLTILPQYEDQTSASMLNDSDNENNHIRNNKAENLQ